MFEFFLLFLKSYSCFASTLFLGHLLFSFCKGKSNNAILDSFFKLIAGILFIVCSFSIYKSGFKTINISISLVLITYLYQIRNNLKLPNLKKTIISFFNQGFYISSIFYVACFFILGYFFYDFTFNTARVFNNDYLFYSDLSKGLNFTGIENPKSVFFQFENPQKITLYHYFDLWLNAFYSNFLGSQNLKYFTALILITYPILISTFFIGLIGFFYQLNFKKYVWFFILIVPFSISFPFITEFDFMEYTMNNSLGNVYALKLLSNYVFVLAAMILLANSNFVGFILFLIICLLSYSTTLVALIPALFFILFLFYIKKQKDYNLKESAHKDVVIFSISLISLFITLYFLKDEADIVTLIPNDSYKTMLIVFIEYLIKTNICYLPVIIIGLYTVLNITIQRERFLIILFSIFCFIALIFGAIFSSFFHGILNMSQAITNIIPCCYTALYIYCFYFILKYKLKFLPVFLVCIFSVTMLVFKQELAGYIRNNITNNYSKEFVFKATKSLNENIAPKILLLREKPLTKNPHTYVYYTPLNYIPSICNNISQSYDIAPKLTNNYSLPYNAPSVKGEINTYITKNKISHILCEKEWIEALKNDNNFKLLEVDNISKNGFFEIIN